MIKFKNCIDIDDISDFNLVVGDIIDEFLEPLCGNEKYCIWLETEEDYENYNIDSDEGITWIWNNNISHIVERAIDRFGKVAEHYFPEDMDYYDISLNYMREC